MSVFHRHRIWRPRRIVLTRERFYIGRPASLDVNDSIPLHEIDEVIAMDDESEPTPRALSLASKSINIISRDSPISRSGVPDFSPPPLDSFRPAKFSEDISTSPATENENTYRAFLAQSRLNNVLQIKTAADGLSSGRTYYISTRSNSNAADCRQALVKQLSAQARIARRKAEAKSRFRRSQDKVKAVQSSMPFQLCMASLIIAVSIPAAADPGRKPAGRMKLLILYAHTVPAERYSRSTRVHGARFLARSIL